MMAPRISQSYPGRLLSLSSGFRREFLAVSLIFGIPYCLAVFCQDFAAPLAGDGQQWVTIAMGIVATLIVGGAIACKLFTAHPFQERWSNEPVTCNLIWVETSEQDLDSDLSDLARHLVTLARWLRHDASGTAKHESTRLRLTELSVCAERLGTTLQSCMNRRSQPRGGASVHSIRARRIPTRPSDEHPRPSRMTRLA
jgi:hypothetical protein